MNYYYNSNNRVNSAYLNYLIQNSSIETKLSYITYHDNEVDIAFNNELTVNEKTTLDNILLQDLDKEMVEKRVQKAIIKLLDTQLSINKSTYTEFYSKTFDTEVYVNFIQFDVDNDETIINVEMDGEDIFEDGVCLCKDEMTSYFLYEDPKSPIKLSVENSKSVVRLSLDNQVVRNLKIKIKIDEDGSESSNATLKYLTIKYEKSVEVV